MHLFKHLWQRDLPPSGPTKHPMSQLSNQGYKIVETLLAQVEQGADWPQLEVFLQQHQISTQQLAEWMTHYGGHWVVSPDQTVGERLCHLSKIAPPELADIAELLGREILHQVGTLTPKPSQSQVEEGITLTAVPCLDLSLPVTGNNPGQPIPVAGQSDNTVDNSSKNFILSDLCEAWFEQGNALYDLDRYDEVITSYDQALKIKPDCHEAWNNRGIALRHLGRYDEAIASYDQALKIKPDYHEAWINRGIAVGRPSGHSPISPERFASLFVLEVLSSLSFPLQEFIETESENLVEQLTQELQDSCRLLSEKFEARNSGATVEQFYASLHCSQNLLLEQFKAQDTSPLLAHIQAPPPDTLAELICTPLPPALQAHIQAPSTDDLVSQIRYPQSPQLVAFLEQPVSDRVIQQITADAMDHPSRFRKELQLRGYQGELNSYRAELGENSQDQPKKAICKDTHPQGWGELHRAVGQAHYFEGRRQASPHSYWSKAVHSFKRALETLQPPKLEALYLATLQDLIRVLVNLHEDQEAQILQQQGRDYLERELQNLSRSDSEKQQLALQRSQFAQLTVDLAIQSGDINSALSQAELAKNVCLRWLLGIGEVPEISFEQIQALLSPQTAVIDWHLSPVAITTFLLLPGAEAPVLITPPTELPKSSQGEPLHQDQRSDSLKQLLCWENWLSNWNQQYESYISAKDKTDTNLDLTTWRQQHPWRQGLEDRLQALDQLLNLDQIRQQLQAHAITNLILMPHRDLHRLPLHLFFEHYDCTYLPSAYLGLEQQKNAQPISSLSRLLVAENPQSTNKSGLRTKKLAELPFAEVEAAWIRQLFREANPDVLDVITTLESQQVSCKVYPVV